MNLPLATALTLAALAIPAAASPAIAAPACPSRYMTAAEFAQLDFGTTAADTWRIVGSWGRALQRESTRAMKMFVWDWCTDGTYVADQWLGFSWSPAANAWVIAEIR